MNRPALGITIIEHQQKGRRTYSLFTKNGMAFYILVNFHFLGFCLRTKMLQFDQKEQAYLVYREMIASNGDPGLARG